MNEQQINGAIEQGKGRIKEAAGALMGDIRTKASGAAGQLRGQAESAYGDVLERATAIAAERPMAAVLGALGLGVLLGLLLARN